MRAYMKQCYSLNLTLYKGYWSKIKVELTECYRTAMNYERWHCRLGCENLTENGVHDSPRLGRSLKSLAVVGVDAFVSLAFFDWIKNTPVRNG